jgi:Bacteriophage tail sheath protein
MDYPGVYVQEVMSVGRAISGVPTSITAFVGRTRRGPVNEPTIIRSYFDYDGRFGGSWRDSTTRFSVRDFFDNDGEKAVIVRLVRNASPAQFVADTLSLEAADPGTWANGLEVTTEDVDDADITASLGVAVGDVFNLKIVDATTGETETHVNVTVVESPRRVDTVLDGNSRMLRVGAGLPSARPAAGTVSASTDGTDGDPLVEDSYIGAGLREAHQGLFALDDIDLFNLLCIPPPTVDGDTPPPVYQQALDYCVEHRAMLIVDPPAAMTVANGSAQLGGLGLTGDAGRNAALYFPRIRRPDPTAGGQLNTFVGSGAVAGVIARTDIQRGVWKAPAGNSARLHSVVDLAHNVTDDQNGRLIPIGVNCLRTFPGAGPVIWGARTLRGADQFADEYKYVPVRRLALYIEESVLRGTRWALFEPNGEPLWAQLRLSVGTFMRNLFTQGALQGNSPTEAYLVKCDEETMTPDDISNGWVNIVIGYAPLRPAEFVVLGIQQIGQPGDE